MGKFLFLAVLIVLAGCDDKEKKADEADRASRQGEFKKAAPFDYTRYIDAPKPTGNPADGRKK
jgi:hypothetical protein